MEESKEADPDLVDTGDMAEMVNPQVDMGHGGVMQAVTQTQCNNSDTTQDWDTEVLNHALVHVLDKDKMNGDVTNDFTVFVIG